LPIGSFGLEQCEQLAHTTMLGLEVPKGHVPVDGVVVAASDPRADQVPLIDQVGQDSHDRPDGDPRALGDLADPNRGVPGYAQQHDEVAGHERPPPLARTILAPHHMDMLPRYVIVYQRSAAA